MNGHELIANLPISARFRALRHAIQVRRSPEMHELLEHLRIIEAECTTAITIRSENEHLKNEILKLRASA